MTGGDYVKIKKLLVKLLTAVFLAVIIIICILDYMDKISINYDLFTCIATIASVLVALRLGVIANNQNKRLMELEEKTYNSNHRCDVILSNELNATTRLSNENSKQYNVSGQIKLNIFNCGNSVLKLIQLDFGNNNFFKSHIVIAPDKGKNVIIDVPVNTPNMQKIKVTYVSCYDVKTYGDFVIYSDDNRKRRIKYYHYYGLE